MSAVWDPIPASSRNERLRDYACFLAERDGEPDFERRTLSRREPSATAFETSPLRWTEPFSLPDFEQQHNRFDPKRPTPAAMAMLLAFVKINANEAFGVMSALRRRRLGEDLASQIERVVLLEEGYHTRLLLSAAVLFGVRISKPARPAMSTRAIVAGIAGLPEFASRPILLAGEILAVVTFLRLLGAVRHVFRGNGEVRDSLEARVTEVLVDELGHMSFNRILATPGTFTALRALLPVFALSTHGALPEAETVGVLPIPAGEVLSFDAKTLPEEVRRRAFIV